MVRGARVKTVFKFVAKSGRIFFTEAPDCETALALMRVNFPEFEGALIIKEFGPMTDAIRTKSSSVITAQFVLGGLTIC
jgi:hypothetical protein